MILICKPLNLIFVEYVERELVKAAALVSNLCPNASDPQSVGVSSQDNAANARRKSHARRESHCGTSSHSQSDSDNLPDDHQTSSASEWKFEWHIYFQAGRWPAGKTYEDAVREALEELYFKRKPFQVTPTDFLGAMGNSAVSAAFD